MNILSTSLSLILNYPTPSLHGVINYILSSTNKLSYVTLQNSYYNNITSIYINNSKVDYLNRYNYKNISKLPVTIVDNNSINNNVSNNDNYIESNETYSLYNLESTYIEHIDASNIGDLIVYISDDIKSLIDNEFVYSIKISYNNIDYYNLPILETSNSLYYITKYSTFDNGCIFPSINNYINNIDIKIQVPLGIKVICSGKSNGSILGNNSITYSYNASIRSNNFGFVAGPLIESLNTSNFKLYGAEILGLSNDHYCTVMEFSTSEVPNIISLYTQLLGEISNNLKFIFLDIVSNHPDYDIEQGVYGDLIILSKDLLHGADDIESRFNSIFELARSIAVIFVNHFFGEKLNCDAWILIGLREWLVNKYIESVHGATEAFYDRLQANSNVCALEDSECRVLSLEMKGFDKKDHPPLHFIAYRVTHPHRIIAIPLYRQKSQILIHLIEEKLNMTVHAQSNASKTDRDKTPFFKLLNLLMNRVQDVDEKLTKKLVTMAKTCSPSSLQQLMDYWVEQSGIPKLSVNCSYNRKKNVSEIIVTNTARKFEGYLTILVQEAGGPYSYQEDLNESLFEYECHSKIRKRKRQRPNYKSDDFEVDVYEIEGDDISIISPVKWFCIDPDLSLIRNIQCTQPQTQNVTELYHSRNLMMQLDAISGLEKYIDCKCVAALTLALQNTVFFWRVRAACAQSLAKIAGSNNGAKCIEILFNYFRGAYFVAELDYTIPKANNFSNLEDYLLKKSIIKSIASIRNTDDFTPIEIAEFILEILKKNDNSLNRFSDSWFISELISSCGNFRLLNSDLRTRDIIKSISEQFHRFFLLEQMFSTRSEITCALFTACTSLVVSGYSAYINIKYTDTASNSLIELLSSFIGGSTNIDKPISLKIEFMAFECLFRVAIKCNNRDLLKKLFGLISNASHFIKNGRIRSLRSSLLDSKDLDVLRVYSKENSEFMKFFFSKPSELVNRHELIDCYCILYGKDAPFC